MYSAIPVCSVREPSGRGATRTSHDSPSIKMENVLAATSTASASSRFPSREICSFSELRVNSTKRVFPPMRTSYFIAFGPVGGCGRRFSIAKIFLTLANLRLIHAQRATTQRRLWLHQLHVNCFLAQRAGALTFHQAISYEFQSGESPDRREFCGRAPCSF